MGVSGTGRRRVKIGGAVCAAVLCLCLCLFGCAARDSAAIEPPARYAKEWSADDAFDETECAVLEKGGGALRILQLTDIHFDDHNDRREDTLRLLTEEISREKPHLVTVTGDFVSNSYFFYGGEREKYGLSDEKNDSGEIKGLREARSREIFELIDSECEKVGAKWAPVFGNHDAEGELSEYDFADIFATYPNCLFKAGYGNLKGAGNYVVEIKENGRLAQAVFMMNSHGSLKKGGSKYDCLSKAQIEWYKWAVDGLDAIYKDGGGALAVVPSLMFLHIPLNEYPSAYKKAAGTADIVLGANREKSGVPYKNTGMFDAIIKKGSTAAVFCGHDHDNNAAVKSKGVTLAYGVQSGWCKEYATESKKGSLTAVFDGGGLKIYHNYSEIF